MPGNLYGGPKASHSYQLQPDIRPTALSDARLAAWAMLIEEKRQSVGSSGETRRIHRGMLPDVDFSMVVPDPSRPSLLRRAVGLVRQALGWRQATTDPDAAASGSEHVAVVAVAAATYNPSAGDGASQPAETTYQDVRAA